MDNTTVAANAIFGVLSGHSINITQGMKTDILDTLSRFNIVMELFNTINDTEARIKSFLIAKKVDGLSEKTLKTYEYRLKRFAKITKSNPDSTSTDDIRRYLTYLVDEKHYKETSLASAIDTLRSFYSWLYIEEIIKKNPMQKIKSIKFNKKKLRKPLTIEEIEKIRNSYTSIRDKALFELLYSTGCRLAEVVHIDLDDINFFERSVIVTGKGNKERMVYFSTRAKLFIQEYLRVRKGDNNALFITSIKPYKRLGERTIENDIRRMGTMANISSKVFPHVLRHYGECLQMVSEF